MPPKSSYTIAVMPGDGIGQEVISSTLEVLNALTPLYGLDFKYSHHDYGAGLYKRTGQLITAEDMDTIRSSSDAILGGAFGHPQIRLPDGTEVAPQHSIRDHYNLFASLRPSKLYPGVPTRLTFPSEKDKVNLDILVVRELTEGMFAGTRDSFTTSDEAMTDRMTITRTVSTKLFQLAFSQARHRKRTYGTRGRVTLLHKSNVLRSNALFQNVFRDVAALSENKDIQSAEHYIDAGAMFFVTSPERYDVVVTENIFGDIVSEIGAGIVGGLGVSPSGDVNGPVPGSKEVPFGLFQPSHGSAPDIAGKGWANPVAAVLSAALMLEWLGEVNGDAKCDNAARGLRDAVGRVLKEGPRTRDLGGEAGTKEVEWRLVEVLREGGKDGGVSKL